AGIVELDAGGRVVGFEEKPAHPRGDLANAGVYLARRGLLDRIPHREGIVDFGHDVLPALAGEIHGHVIEQFIADIGTPTALAAASDAWARHQRELHSGRPDARHDLQPGRVMTPKGPHQ
nr:sugar phosphate nucleotidyltransferase [Vicinamibacterales bacterium]